MKSIKRWAAIGACTLLTAGFFAFAPAENESDPPGTIEFAAKNNRYSAQGSFKEWHLKDVNLHGGDMTKVEATVVVEMASVSEKVDKLAQHLRQWDFFDVEKFAEAHIHINGAEKVDDKHYTTTAKAKIKGIEGDLPIEFEVVSEKPLTIKGTGKVNRTTFQIGMPLEGYANITEDVEVTFELTLEE